LAFSQPEKPQAMIKDIIEGSGIKSVYYGDSPKDEGLGGRFNKVKNSK
jgi:hypothetical protein